MKGLKQRIIPWLVIYAFFFLVWLPVEYSFDRSWPGALLRTFIFVLYMTLAPSVITYFKKIIRKSGHSG